MAFEIGNFGSLANVPVRSETLFANGLAQFGKYQGQKFDDILASKPKYLAWVVKNVEKHGLSRDQMKLVDLACEQQDEAQEDADRELDFNAPRKQQAKDFWS